MTEIQSGSSGATSFAAAIAAFAFSVSKIVSIRSRSTPPSRRPRICSAYDSTTWSKLTARKAGSSTFGESESVTFSGPSEPATKRSPTSSAACRARLRPGDVHVVHRALEPVVRLADRGRRERVRRRDVGAGREVAAVDVEDDVGPRQVEQVGIAGDLAADGRRSARRGNRRPRARRAAASSPRRRRGRRSARPRIASSLSRVSLTMPSRCPKRWECRRLAGSLGVF